MPRLTSCKTYEVSDTFPHTYMRVSFESISQNTLLRPWPCDLCVCVSDHDLDDLEMQVVRYKPEGLDALCRNTKFSRKELQIMYRGFKQVYVKSTGIFFSLK